MHDAPYSLAVVVRSERPVGNHQRRHNGREQKDDWSERSRWPIPPRETDIGAIVNCDTMSSPTVARC